MPMPLNKYLVVFSASLITAACGPVTHQTQTDNRNTKNIIGGVTVSTRISSASRSVVYLRIKDSYNNLIQPCTGTLIAPNTVLTAAHCLNYRKYKNITTIEVVFTNNSKTENVPVRVSKWFDTHPLYNTTPYETYEWKLNTTTNQYEKNPIFLPGKNHDHDIAVVVFKGSIPQGYQSIDIDTDAEKNYTGEKDYAYGYGYNIDYGDAVPANQQVIGILKKGELVVGDFSLEKHFYWANPVNNAYICQGDSGGPHFYSENGVTKLIGVSSCSSGDYAPEKKRSCMGRAKVTRVAVFADWIKSTRRQLLKNIQ